MEPTGLQLMDNSCKLLHAHAYTVPTALDSNMRYYQIKLDTNALKLHTIVLPCKNIEETFTHGNQNQT